MDYYTAKYPCALKKGCIVITKSDSRERKVDRADWKYIYFKDGSQYGLSHPDIVGAEVKIPRKPKAKKEEPKEQE